MSITAATYAAGTTLEALQDRVNDLVTQGYRPHGSPASIGGQYVQTMVDGSVEGTFEDLTTRVEALEASMSAAEDEITTLQTVLAALDDRVTALEGE